MTKAKASISPRAVMVHARDLCRMGVRRFGGTYRQYLPQALRMAWAEIKRRRAATAAMEARVLACVEAIRAEGRVRRERAAAVAALPTIRRAIGPARLRTDSWAGVPAARAA